MKELISAEQLDAGIRKMAEQITSTVGGRPLTVIGVLTGSVVLLADLIRQLKMPLRVGFVQASSYRGQLERGMRAGASGAIAGSANILPEVIKAIVHDDNEEPNLPLLIDELLKRPIIPAVKALIAYRLDSPAWLSVRPPLTQLASAQISSLGERLDVLFPN